MKTFNNIPAPRNRRYPSNPTHYIIVRFGYKTVRVDIYPIDYAIWNQVVQASDGQIIAYLPLYETRLQYTARTWRQRLAEWWEKQKQKLDAVLAPSSQDWDYPAL